MLLECELPALEAELAKYDAEEALGLVRLRTDLAARQVSFTEKSIEQVGLRIKAARELAAVESVRKAKLEAIAADPSLKAYADQNQELAEKAKLVAESLARAEQDLKAATEVHEQLIRQFKQTRTKVESVGLTSSVGALLRKQRSTLPDVRQRKAAVANRQALINDTQYKLFEYDDERQTISDVDNSIADMVGNADGAGNSEVLDSAARELLSSKQEYLDALIRNSGQYFDTLIELDTTDQQVIAVAAEYENFIDQRVLWIRSARTLTSDFSIEPSDTWLLQTDKWAELATTFGQDVGVSFPLYLLASILLGTLFVRGRRLRQRICDAGAIAQKANCRSIGPTLQTICVTTLVSADWPLLCAFLGWRLGRASSNPEFVKAVSQGLICVSVVWLAIELLRQVCRPLGLAAAHFRWSTAATEITRRELHILLLLALPIVFVTGTLSASDAAHGRNAIERVAYAAGMCLLSFVAYRSLRPSGVLRDYFARHQTGWTDRFKYVWGVIAAGVPLTLAFLAVMGYYYTAEVLFWRVFATGMFVMGLIVMRSLLLRMVLLRRRSLSIEQARQRAAAASAGADSDRSNPVAGIVTATPESDITTHSLQSQRLVNTALLATSMVGLWFIWVQVLPALGMLDKYPLWGGTAAPIVSVANLPVTTGMLPSAMPASSTETAEASETLDSVVTASDLALAILIAVVTFVLARNGPGLLEMSVLQQLPVDASVRYAITSLVSYAIVLIGTIATCSTIGLQWSQIQWLATALTFGLAFGLQEMFANFVAGLIILLERPIRVGDIVTVDDVTGVVSRIRIRATSITNWDRKEYVVPNKEFITGRLLNWTLSDKVNRIVINVGLAYGSDTERAREILLQTANDHPLILKDPPSVATFEGFGDNSLNLVLRTYLPTLDNRLEVIHQLHTAIDQAFRKARIEIAFPQRDLHVRTFPNALGIAPNSDALDGDQLQQEPRREVA